MPKNTEKVQSSQFNMRMPTEIITWLDEKTSNKSRYILDLILKDKDPNHKPNEQIKYAKLTWNRRPGNIMNQIDIIVSERHIDIVLLVSWMLQLTIEQVLEIRESIIKICPEGYKKYQTKRHHRTILSQEYHDKLSDFKNGSIKIPDLTPGLPDESLFQSVLGALQGVLTGQKIDAEGRSWQAVRLADATDGKILQSALTNAGYDVYYDSGLWPIEDKYEHLETEVGFAIKI